jgi:hypothetical protein
MFAVIWHWWLGFFLSVGAILAIAAVVVGYIAKVQRPRYPRKS